MIVIKSEDDAKLADAAALLNQSKKTVALTGAGISVGSGIPDFRSAGGLWSVYSPEEYATLEVFLRAPEKAWELYRALGNTLLGKHCNPAHKALSELEKKATHTADDIDEERLHTSQVVADKTAAALGVEPTIEATTDRAAALDGADYAISMFQVAGVACIRVGRRR